MQLEAIVDAVPETFGPREFQEATCATASQMEDLERYRVMLEDWNQRLNLVGPSAMANFWRRHAFDSAQLLQIEPDAKVWVDLGSGAGLPGVVLAILLKDTPEAYVHLVESLAKRCKFLDAVVATLGLPARVRQVRAEQLKLTGIDVVTARAFAPLTRLLEYAQPCLRGRTRGLFPKGRDVEAELSDAKRIWRFEVELIPSLSDPSGRIARIKGLARV